MPRSKLKLVSLTPLFAALAAALWSANRRGDRDRIAVDGAGGCRLTCPHECASPSW